MPNKTQLTNGERRLTYPADGITLGQGWHLFPGKGADAYCIEFAPPASTGAAQTVYTDVLEVRSHETSRKHITSGNELSAKALVDLTSKLDISATITRALEYKSYSILARVENSPETILPPAGEPIQLKDKYVAVLKSGAEGVRRFVAECGQGFVLRRTGGADLSALTTLRTMTLEEQSKSDVKLGLSGKIGDFSIGIVNPELSESQLNAIKSTMVFTYTLRGGNSSVGASSSETLSQLIATLPKLAEDAPKYWHMDVRSYTSLPNFPKEAEVDQSFRSQDVALGRYIRYREIADYTAYALSNPGEFEPLSFNVDQLRRINTQATDYVVRLSAAFRSCIQDSTLCSQLPTQDDAYDYSDRVYFPIRIGFTALSKAHASARQERTRILNRIAEIWAIAKKPNNHCTFDPKGYAPDPLLTEIQDLCKNKLPAIDQTLAQQTPLLPADIRRAIRSAHIRSIRDDRCRVDPTAVNCIPQQQLDEFEKQVEARSLP